MNLNTVEDVWRPARGDAPPPDWRDGDAWLAGGTWLFSEPQPRVRRLLDLAGFAWEPLIVSDEGLQIAATCTVAQLAALTPPAAWQAAPLIQQCCRAFLASFKIWNTATVGGNICMSLPAGPMTSLVVALEGAGTIWRRDGGEERVPMADFVTGNNRNILGPGDLLRAIDLPAAALRKRTSFRQLSLTRLGRSTALLVGTLSPDDGSFLLTVTAATVRPLQLAFPQLPTAGELRDAIAETIPAALYHDDVHGTPDYRRHLTLHFAEAIRRELSR